MEQVALVAGEAEEVVEALFTQVLGVMMQQGLVVLKRAAQDGTRVRASAGAASFRRRGRLEDYLQAAREQVEAVKKQAEGEVDTQRRTRRQAAQERAARQRAERVEKAVEELVRIEKQPMVEQVEERVEKKPEELLVDGGLISKESVEAVAAQEVTLYGPVPERKGAEDPYEVKPGDSPALADWKRRMATPEAKLIYRERAATAETVNADLKTWRTLGRFLVRGKRKVFCVLLWNVLAYNIMRWLALAPNG